MSDDNSRSGQGAEKVAVRVRKQLSVKFEVGEVLVTPAASAALELNGQLVDDLLVRHQAGDWGDVTEQMRAVNDRGLAEQFNLQSIYDVPTGERIVVVTNRERSMTMVHLAGRAL